ncbi:hypothetical protein K458DRAFT_389958 [Lentithecium fluviatile CBS 122367]|uniref:Uncharacterized protein n=1 Tax=Lentithecium fluviatile CBS 122367 TaxID=1168545 RepID=A0A6G1IYL9_9PLEO|nr:hypothetical protein K458DRAFT_389958 [Lentithecium fluviatile CBS 122367]
MDPNIEVHKPGQPLVGLLIERLEKAPLFSAEIYSEPEAASFVDAHVESETETATDLHTGSPKPPAANVERLEPLLSSPAPSTPELAIYYPQLGRVNSLRDILFVKNPREHIAAAYAQCNICLEEHVTVSMHNVAQYEHQYRMLCPRQLLRMGNVRRYNCSSCRS